MALGYGVMVTLQILVLSFQVRILVAQQEAERPRNRKAESSEGRKVGELRVRRAESSEGLEVKRS